MKSTSERDHHLRALVVDDDDGVRALLQRVLKERGWDVDAIANPTLSSCKAMLGVPCSMSRPCYDLIISDVHMPEMTGLEFVGALERGGCRCRRRIMISGDSSADEVAQSEKMGLELMLKPLDMTALLRRLDVMERGLGL